VTDDIYFANFKEIESDEPSIRRWRGFFPSMVRISVSLHDRTDTVRGPFRLRTFPDFALPDIPDGFSMTYEEAVLSRAREFAALQDKLGIPIYLMYSGGIDSTVMLLAFNEVLGNESKDRIEVALTQESINENPRLFYEFIRPKFRMVSSELFAYQFDRSRIIISGEHNDQLFGSDTLGDFLKIVGYDGFEVALAPRTRDSVVRFLVEARGVERDIAEFWYDLLDDHIAKVAPVPVERVFDFFWWLNFTFKWQNVYFRILLRVAPHLRGNINLDFLRNYFFHFFSSADLQRWSMLNPDKKIVRRWDSYKVAAKQFIYDRTKDDEYFSSKLKVGSLWRLFVQNNPAGALTTDFKYLPIDVDPMLFFEANNDFAGG
jgi:hypothetical protein